MKFSSVRIILIATSHPGNIGSTARAMKTMGFSRLYVVTPKSFPDSKANEMAAGADDVLDSCIISRSFDEALAGCQLIIATSARPRGIPLPGFTPFECADFLCQQADDTEVAIVFGREHAGLTNDELLRCHYHVNIPSNPDYSSLNLSQAVQIITYELRMKLIVASAAVGLREEKLAKAEEVEQFFEHLEKVLIAIDFLKPNNPRRLQHRLRRLFNRVQLEHMEVNILRGILTQVQKAMNKNEHHCE